MVKRVVASLGLTALLLAWPRLIAAQQTNGNQGPAQEGMKTTPAYQETGEPEGDAFHFSPLTVDPRARALGDPMLDRLVRRIETGEANLIERRAWDWLYPRLFPFEKPVPANWQQQAQARIRLMEEAQRQGALAVGLPEAFVANVWSPIGPAAYTNGSDTNSGRATAIWSDPANKNTVLLGTADGGVWKTTDQGSTWYPILDTAASLSIGSIAVDPNNKQVLYVGTGEGNSNGDMINGIGMYKSTDGGTTWTLLSLPAWTYSTFWHSIRRIAVDPLDSNKVYAAIDGGLIYSSNAGASWTKTTCGASGGTYIGSDLVLDSVNGSAGQSIIYVAFGYPAAVSDNGIYRSATGGGGTWTKISSGGGFPVSSVGRISLALSPSDPKQLYALIQNTGTSGSLGIFYTGAANAVSVAWSAKSTTNYCSTQCWYDMTGVVHPTTPGDLMVGGLDDYISTDTGGTLTQVSQWNSSGSVYSHADHHHLVMADATTLYDANDGGFFIGTVNWGTKSVTWTNKNAGLRTLQFYGFAQHPTDATKVVGGLQDNGEAYDSGATWTEAFGGDGGKSAWDQSSAGYAYEEYVYAYIQRNSNMTGTPTSWTCLQTFGGCSCGFGCDPDGSTAFIAPFTLDANNQNTLYTGSRYLYVNGAARTGTSWTKPSTTDLIAGAGGNYVTAIHSAKNGGTAGTLYIGTSNGQAWITPDSGTTMTNVSTGLSGASVTSFTTDPANGQRVLVTLSGFGTSHVYRSTNGGGTWADITGGLPVQPFNCIALDPANSNTAYAGSDFGVFTNTAVWTGNTWTSITGNLPAVSVQEIGFNVSTGKVRVATHGRGIWELGTVTTASYPQETSPSHNMTATKGAGTSVNLTYTNPCGVTDNTVYYGNLGTLAGSGVSWSGRSCSEGATGSCTFDPGAGSFYFVIVGNNVLGMEGSYGKDSSNVEIPSAGPGSPCAYTQVLNATCP